MLNNTCNIYNNIYIKCLKYHRHEHHYCKYIFTEMLKECIKDIK